MAETSPGDVEAEDGREEREGESKRTQPQPRERQEAQPKKQVE